MGRPDGVICVTGLEPSAFDPPTPGYRTCLGELVVLEGKPAGHVPRGCAIINPSVIATDRASWSGVKGRYSP